MRLRIEPPVATELDEAVDYYEDQRLGLGDELYYEFRRALDAIMADPTGPRKIWRDMRKHNLKRFRYMHLSRRRR